MKHLSKKFIILLSIIIGCLFINMNTLFAGTIGYDGLGPCSMIGRRDMKWPVQGYYNIQSCFYDHRNHYGIDIAAPKGTKIYAAYEGIVAKVNNDGWGSGYGNYVIVKHENYILANGNKTTVFTRYNHMNSTSVKEGNRVTKNSILGYVGSTGSSSGNHLDFQIFPNSNWNKTNAIDPYSNQLLELPSNLLVYDEWTCGKDYVNLVKNLYSKPLNYSNSLPTISGANFPTTSLKKGQTFSVYGTIYSDTLLKNVTVGIYNTNGVLQSGKTCYPNSTTFNIHSTDKYILFNYLADNSTYYYKITATNASGSTVLLNKQFTVGTVSDKKNTKKNQTITASNITKTYGCSSFKINAKLTVGNGKLTYTSSNPNVATVSSNGTVKVKGIGTSKITIKAASTSKYNAATKSITVKVKPKTITLKSTSNLKGKKLKINWTKNTNASGYIIEYSTNKSFKSSKSINVTNRYTTSYTLKNLTKNKTYYIRIRTYKTVSSTKYYSDYSKTKSCKIQK